ncbi:MAG: hypothetical protein EPN53_14265 [Acidobacteria bacterium]|nr:MAG: hypothetical protein EPN53_14265 [Acidobacteriota bacterium]
MVGGDPRLFDKEVTPYSDAFVEALESYCGQMAEAIRKHKHHDHRRNLLLNFFRQGLDLDPIEFELERKVRADAVRGRIDAFFRQLIIEVKTDLERERGDAHAELKKYFESQARPDDYVGLVTDGLNFEVYIYEGGSVRQIRNFALDSASPLTTFRHLDQLFFTAQRLHPTPGDIVDRFGLHSTAYNAVRRSLLAAFEAVQNQSSVEVKFREWNGLLAKVYGSEVGDRTLFITHTYLAILSRVIVTMALFPKARRTPQMLRGIVTGAFFRRNRLVNLAEPDFFAWALGNPAEPVLLAEIERLFAGLEIYNFERLDGDILKELYQGLVGAPTRHDLGEYYTPDWLAELTLERIDYRGGRLLDPACGSGTFLYAAARRLRRVARLSGAKLVKAVTEDIIGIDVHPVAVLMAKANLLLSLKEEVASYAGEIGLQVYMADTLTTGEDRSKSALVVPVSGDEEAFHIPSETVDRGAGTLDALIDGVCDFAGRGAGSSEKERLALKGLQTKLRRDGLSKNEEFFWRQNFRLLVKLEREGRNTIWAYILKNAYRPAYVRREKVDYLVGNPPWLAYAFIKNKAYKKRVKELTFEHDLLKKTDRNLFTRMDTSTLFFSHCQRDFLRPNGTIALVMPKTAMLPAKQHLRFQRRGFSEALDFSAVTPLFNVRSCVLIRTNEVRAAGIPCTGFRGDLRAEHNMPWAKARQLLTTEIRRLTFAPANVEYSPYHPKFFQGATLVPRCLWFVELAGAGPANPMAPFVRTSRAAHSNAKQPWTMEVEGQVEKDFLFATVLAKDLLPFVVRKLSLVVLPVRISRDDRLAMVDAEAALADGFVHAHDWFERAEAIWEAHRSSESRTAFQWLNYDNKLTNQPFKCPFFVLFNQSGTNVSAAMVPVADAQVVGALGIRGLVVDSKCYWFATKSEDEAHYLTGILNSEVVNAAIKPLQTQGLQGERDIHRRPLEACNIPIYDSGNQRHQRIVELARECRARLIALVPKMQAAAGRIRGEARRIVRDPLARLDTEVEALLATASDADGTDGRGASQGKLFD